MGSHRFFVTCLFMWGLCYSAVNVGSMLFTCLCESLLFNSLCFCYLLLLLCGVSVTQSFVLYLCYLPFNVVSLLLLLLCNFSVTQFFMSGLCYSAVYVGVLVTHQFMWWSLLMTCLCGDLYYSPVYVGSLLFNCLCLFLLLTLLCGVSATYPFMSLLCYSALYVHVSVT